MGLASRLGDSGIRVLGCGGWQRVEEWIPAASFIPCSSSLHFVGFGDRLRNG